jgi:hypothetical protein
MEPVLTIIYPPRVDRGDGKKQIQNSDSTIQNLVT